MEKNHFCRNLLENNKEFASKRSTRKKDENATYFGETKKRLVWNDVPDLQTSFIKAVEQLGDFATPKKILQKMGDYMDTSQVTIKHVASHWQKHRLKKRKLNHESAKSDDNSSGKEELSSCGEETEPKSTEAPKEDASINTAKHYKVVQQPHQNYEELEYQQLKMEPITKCPQKMENACVPHSITLPNPSFFFTPPVLSYNSPFSSGYLWSNKEELLMAQDDILNTLTADEVCNLFTANNFFEFEVK